MLHFKKLISGHFGLIFLIAILAFASRVFYAWDLPCHVDEGTRIEIARAISLSPENFHFPLGDSRTNHPLLSVYFLALGQAIGGQSIFFSRLLFIMLNMAGLAGVYFLARELFGPRAGALALGLASLDRCLTAAAPNMLSQSGYFLVPWIILFFYRAAANDESKSIFYFGVVCGIAYLFYELTILVVPGLIIWTALTGRFLKMLRRPSSWLGLACFLIIISPDIYWNLSHSSVNFMRHMGKASALGVSMRSFILYLGDIIVSLSSPHWLVPDSGIGTYNPFLWPCSFFSGAIYLICVVWSLKYIGSRGTALLLLCFATPFLAATAADPVNPWASWWWATASLFPAIILTSACLDKLLNVNKGRLVAHSAIGAILLLHFVFLAGPKRGYGALDRETRFVGQMIVETYSHRPESQKNSQDVFETRMYKLASGYVIENPDSFYGHYYLAKSLKKIPVMSERHFIIAQNIAPKHVLVLYEKAEKLQKLNKWDEAYAVLATMHNMGEEPHFLKAKMAYAAHRAGLSAIGEKDAIDALPTGRPKPYLYLFLIWNEMGKTLEAEQALNEYIARFWEDRQGKGFLEVARHLAKEGKQRQAGRYMQLYESLK